MNEVMLSTIDNPYNPFTHYDEWYAFDVAKGYNTCAYLDRVTITSDELSEADYELAVRRAMDEIVELNVLGIYVKVERKV